MYRWYRPRCIGLHYNLNRSTSAMPECFHDDCSLLSSWKSGGVGVSYQKMRLAHWSRPLFLFQFRILWIWQRSESFPEPLLSLSMNTFSRQFCLLCPVAYKLSLYNFTLARSVIQNYLRQYLRNMTCVSCSGGKSYLQLFSLLYAAQFSCHIYRQTTCHI